VGAARWFAVERVALFEQLPDRRAEISDTEIRRYVSESPLQASTAAAVQAAVPHSSLQLLNVARDSLMSFFPHCISKINRVAYGLLPAWMNSESESITRRYMAIPFEGKDTPSAASEFSHPDILIILTLLAYRYEGLRPSDMQKVVSMLKASLKREAGPLKKRPSYRTFEHWLATAESTQADVTSAAILPLELFDPNDGRQGQLLWSLLRRQRAVISFFIRKFVFPQCLHHKHRKISATGEELGGETVFKVRLGFSGTPSTLLPTSLGQCDFEPGTEGQIARVLSDPRVVSARTFDDWSVEDILTSIATAEPPIHAIIDIGALITGLENHEVATFLLDHGLRSMSGVVYVSKTGDKVILNRGASEPVPLEQSSVPPGKRLTFYDQHHTTGVDIVQAPTARAVVTIGKDSVLRDYAQGAWRMRRLGQGQTLQVWLIPEVARLVSAAVDKAHMNPDGPLINSTMAWLAVNSIRAETLQAAKLRVLQAGTIARTAAFKQLLGVAPALVARMQSKTVWLDAAEREIEKLNAAHMQNLAKLSAQLQQAQFAEMERMKMQQGYGNSWRLHPNLSQEERDAHARGIEEALAGVAHAFQQRQTEQSASLHEQLELQKEAVRERFAQEAPAHDDAAVVWLHRCMAVLIEPMEFGVASTVKGGPAKQQKLAGYDEACHHLLKMPSQKLNLEPEPEPEIGLVDETSAVDSSRKDDLEPLSDMHSPAAYIQRAVVLAEDLNDRLAGLQATLQSATSRPVAGVVCTASAENDRTRELVDTNNHRTIEASVQLAGRLAAGLQRVRNQFDSAGRPTDTDDSTLSVSGAASVFYDTEVQNEQEQEQQVEILDEDEEQATVFPGGPLVEESFAVDLLRVRGSSKSNMACLDAEAVRIDKACLCQHLRGI
jgi:hypothetical protein